MSRSCLMGAIALPGVAFACGACRNTQLHQESWLLGAVGPAFVLLVVDAVAASLLLPKGRSSGLFSTLTAAVAIIAAVCGFFVAPVFAGLCSGGVLLVRSLGLGALSMKTRRTATMVRLAVVVLAIVGALFRAQPSFRSTDELTELLTATPYVLEPPDGWAVDEFVHRPDSMPRVRRLLAIEPEQMSPPRLLVVAEIYALVGGSAAALAPACSRLRETQPPPRGSELERIQRLCEPASERDRHAE